MTPKVKTLLFIIWWVFAVLLSVLVLTLTNKTNTYWESQDLYSVGLKVLQLDTDIKMLQQKKDQLIKDKNREIELINLKYNWKIDSISQKIIQLRTEKDNAQKIYNQLRFKDIDYIKTGLK